MEAKHPISAVVFFELKNQKYETTTGSEVTTKEILANPHCIIEDEGYIILDADISAKLAHYEKMRSALERIAAIEDGVFGLKAFDVKRFKADIQEALNDKK